MINFAGAHMNAIHADPVNTAIEGDESSTSSSKAKPKRSSDIPAAAIDEDQVHAIDAMAACMQESSFGG